MLEFENTSMPLENSRAEPLGFQTDLYQIFLLVDWQLIMDASYKSVSKAVYFLPYLRVHLKKIRRYNEWVILCNLFNSLASVPSGQCIQIGLLPFGSLDSSQTEKCEFSVHRQVEVSASIKIWNKSKYVYILEDLI